jgi:hypothetical protein
MWFRTCRFKKILRLAVQHLAADLLLMLLAICGAVVLAQLVSAEVSIELTADSALVEARYQAVGAADSIGFTLIRLSGQELHLSSGGAASMERQAGLYRISASAANSPTGYSVLQYTVSGDLSRIPIAVPNTPPPLDGASVRIRVRGLDRAAAWAGAFPRLEPQVDGSATAELESVPAFLRTPPGERDWSVNRLADAFVALLVVLATAFWWLRRRSIRERMEAGAR